MPLLRNITTGLRSLFRKEQLDRELDEELRAYKEMAAEENMRDGLSRKEALCAVRLERGSLEVSKEIVRSGAWEFFLETCWQDLRFSLRMLRKAPLFAALATLTLAVGIVATTVMFSVINAVLLRAAPYLHPAQLVKISALNARGEEELVTAGDFGDWKAETKAFEELAAYKRLQFHALTGAGEPDEVWAPEVSTNIFHVLGVNPAFGRTFAPNETQAMLIQSSARLETAPTGFKPDHLLTVRVPLANYKYAQGERSADFYRTVLERIEAIPGVTSAAMANNLPFTGFHTSVNLPGPPNSPGASASSVYVAERSVSPGHFRAMGIPLKSGREFTESDNQKDARCVLIVNETMARRYWPGENPVDKLLPNACPKHASALVVGMVADSKQVSVDAPANPEVYSPYAQFPFASFLVTFVVRTSSNPNDLAAAVRSAVWEVDHDQPVIQVRTMGNVIGESIWPYHVSASMLAIFAVMALVLASVGIYGLLAYSVSQRTHEIGIRLALGARRGDVMRLVIGEGFVLASVGLVAGTVGAIGLTRFLKTLLYGVGPSDPRTYVAVTLILIGVALLACYIPARRAMRVDPIAALRYE